MKLWYEKYRPTTLDDYVWSQGGLKKKVEQWLADPAQFPHLVLAGPSGTGKTTLARIFRDALGIEREDFLFQRASLLNGVDEIRGRVIDFCETGGWSGIKMIVFDEGERLSRDAQEMLRNVIDTYGEYVRFVITCNDPHRIIDPLKNSRMRLITIDALDEEKFANRLIDICEAEEVPVETDDDVLVITELVSECHPNLRRAIDRLQDSVVDGKLVSAEQPEEKADAWEQSIRDVILNGAPIARAREAVMGIDRAEMDRAYRFLFENSEELFGDHENFAVVLIAEYMHKNVTSPFPEITLCACLVKLGEIGED